MIKKTSIQLLLFFAVSFALATVVIPSKSLPFIHNEFANLLMADTLAHFRFLNPVPAFKAHFETVHVLFSPVYASKLPPAEGVVLGIGQIIFGHPIAGVWLWISAFVTVLYWFLLKWFGRPWAIIGTILIGVQMGLTCGWSRDFFLHVYRGGAVSAIGAMLVIGGFKNFISEKKLLNLVIIWSGLSILLFSRPFEGSLVVLPFCGFIAFTTLKNFKTDFLACFAKVWLPFLGLCLFTIFLFGAYNQALTGNPLRMPHAHYSKQYAGAPLFLFQKPFEKRDISNKAMQDYADWQAERFEDKRFDFPVTSENLFRNVRAIVNKCFKVGQHHNRLGAPFLLIFVVLGLPFIVRGLEMKLVFGAFSLNFLGMMLLLPTRLDQMGPALPLISVLFFTLMQYLWNAGAALKKYFRGLVVIILLFLGFLVTERLVQVIQYQYFGKFYEISYTAHRNQLKQQLSQLGGKHLIFVSYPPTHRMTWEWVYNDADFKTSSVLFARDLGEAENEALANAYPERAIWVVFVEKDWNIEQPLPFKLIRDPK